MKKYTEMSETELKEQLAVLTKEYEAAKAKGLKLDMSRGKPSPAQLDVSNEMLDIVNSETGCVSDSGTDCRNYGIMEGIPEARQLMGDFLRVPKENVFVCGNASLNIMYDCVSSAMLFGIMGSTPWCHLDKVKFLCPVPGYDRHFTILEHFGIEMINVDMKQDGPDMDAIEELVKDPSVKGMFCVPKYSNPQGITFSDDVVRRIAALKPAAEDFRIVWDNAYCVHDLVEDGDKLLNIFDVLPEYGNDDMVVEVCSTSKITFPGAGISAIIASDNNIKMIKSRLSAQVISYDKMNQHRHVVFFGDANGVLNHMKKHAAILKPKFDIVIKTLNEELAGKGIASWFAPKGGYFISLDVMDGCAKRVGELCKEAGVTLTSVGATYPYGKDPNNKNIRIAPSFPPVDELSLAAELLCICTRLAAAEKLLG